MSHLGARKTYLALWIHDDAGVKLIALTYVQSEIPSESSDTDSRSVPFLCYMRSLFRSNFSISAAFSISHQTPTVWLSVNFGESLSVTTDVEG